MIDNSFFEIFKIVLASFQIENKLERVWFFQEIFLLVDTNMEIILEIAFLTFGNINIQFTE